MEQRIGSSSQPLEGAGFDPAFIPGLTSPAPGREEDAKARSGDPEEDPASGADDGTEPAAAEAPEPGGEPADPEASDENPESVPDGPVFEASDRRAKIVADHSGVRLRLDDQECEFRWDEIGAVETETARFGKRYTVTVHTPDRRWYFLEIEAPSRSTFAQWDTELDAVLDEYFDEGEDEPGEDPADSAEAAGSPKEAPDAEDAGTDGSAKDTGAKAS